MAACFCLSSLDLWLSTLALLLETGDNTCNCLSDLCASPSASVFCSLALLPCDGTFLGGISGGEKRGGLKIGKNSEKNPEISESANLGQKKIPNRSENTENRDK